MIDDSVKYAYEFILTPLEIVNKDKAKCPCEKKVVVKLGNHTVKFDSFGVPLKIKTDLLYSKIMQKFYPIKGIIKVYDVTKEGNQIISCVGAFQTDDLLNQNKSKEIIDKELGSTRIKMELFAKSIEDEKNQDEKPQQNFSKLNVTPENEQQRQAIESSQNENSILINKLQQISSLDTKNDQTPNFSKTSKPPIKILENEKNKIPFDESSIHHQQSLNLSLSCPQIFEEYQKKQFQILGEQLIQERRKNKNLEEMNQKINLKMQVLKRKNKQYQNCIKTFENQSHKFLESLERNWKGEYSFQLDLKKSILGMKFKKHVDFEIIFSHFIQFISDSFVLKYKFKSKRGEHNKEGNQTELESILDRIDHIYNQKNKMDEQVLYKNKQNISLRKTIEELNKKLFDKKETSVYSKEEFQVLQKKISEQNAKIRNLEEVSSYLKEKDEQMDYLISTKDNSIENLRKMLANVSAQLDELQEENLNLKKAIRNHELKIEEMNEQICNRDETIEKYMQKYGHMKKPQTLEIENQINDCLRWLNQENKIHDETSIDETLQSEIMGENKMENSLSNIMKNNQKIQSLSLDETIKFRNQMMNVIKKMDEIILKSQETVLGENYSPLEFLK